MPTGFRDNPVNGWHPTTSKNFSFKIAQEAVSKRVSTETSNMTAGYQNGFHGNLPLIATPLQSNATPLCAWIVKTTLITMKGSHIDHPTRKACQATDHRV